VTTAQTARHSVSVAAAVVNDKGQVLAIRRRDNSRWEPPGGVLELGEAIEDGLRREVHEETGLIVEPVALTGVYKNMTQGIVALVFRCAMTGGQLTATVETSEFRWLTREQIGAQMTPAYAVRMIDALHDGPPAIRSHDGTVLLAG
jgi:8-oxo-dGTP diphosphatase